MILENPGYKHDLKCLMQFNHAASKFTCYQVNSSFGDLQP